jgi:glycosyltransferase involved in cell wall biosynthesis
MSLSGIEATPSSDRLLSIIIPAYNEAGAIAAILDKVAAVILPLAKELIIVDDASRDATAQIVADWIHRNPSISARLVRHAANAGKGAAVRTGIAAAAGDILLIQDADLEYDPNDYPVILAPILSGRATVVYGSRLGRQSRPQWLGVSQRLANRMLTGLTNLLCRSNLTDMETCYKAFRAEAIKPLRLTARRFDIEPEITIKLLRAGHIIVEVPITYRGRSKAEGKKISWRDGLKGVWAIVKYRYFSRK